MGEVPSSPPSKPKFGTPEYSRLGNRAQAKRRENPLGVFDITKFLFKQQLDFVNDPASFKIAVCSRRAGKTIACAAHLIDTALKTPDCLCLYITLSKNNAKKLVWREVIKINSTHKLGGVPNESDLAIRFPNGSIIYFSGAKDASEIENFRGMPFKLVYIDECQSFREYIRDLIEDVLDAALMDYNGTLCMIGTPSALPTGYFAECAGVVQGEVGESNEWSKHHWTFFDNPWIPIKSGKTHQHALDRVMRRRGVTIDDPSIQREYFGRWVIDSSSLWVRYVQDKDDFDVLPDLIPGKQWHYIMGIDIGHDDADAIAVLAWSESSPITYLIEEEIVAKQDITGLVEMVQKYNTKYPVSKMVIDQGGLGKKIAEEIRRRHHIPVQPADKSRKQETVAFLNDSLRTGVMKARATSRFVQDSRLVEVDKDKCREDKIVISDRYHSDIIDAVIYAYKESPAFTYQAPAKRATPGSPEHGREIENQMFEAELEAMLEQQELNRQMGGG